MEKFWNPRNIFLSVWKTLQTKIGPVELGLDGIGHWFVVGPETREYFVDVYDVCAWLNLACAQETEEV